MSYEKFPTRRLRLGNSVSSLHITYSSHQRENLKKKTTIRDELQNRAKAIQENVSFSKENASELDENFLLNLQRDYAEYLSLNEELKDDRIAFKFGIEDLKDDIGEVETKLQRIRLQSKATDKSLRELQTRLLILNSENELLLHEIASELDKEKSNRENSIKELQLLLKDNEKEIEFQENTIIKLKSEIDAVKKEKIAHKQNIIKNQERELQTRLDELTRLVEQFSSEANEKETLRINLIKKKQQLEDTIFSLQREILAKKRTVDDVEIKLADQKYILEKKKDELKKVFAENERLKDYK
ncbi:keratin, type II cytoskeletal 1-like [Zophobas morio]|uniref:keratin, type II cytoskeletal 1-like n=1 Tax=Zophobas morio TaxID=2755281 RepID=UPI003083E2E5